MLLAAVIGDIALIVVLSWLLGSLARRCGQPAVIGQIVAGILLGPSLLGRLPGDPAAQLFPTEVRSLLSVLSQVAVVLFMFVAGYEIDLRKVRGGGRTTLLVAVCALLVPMALSTAAIGLFRGAFTAVDGARVDGGGFVLFMAVATSITALPVLVAIVRERGISGTPAGSVAVASAGFMDLAAWLVLAAALAGTSQAAPWPWATTLLLVVVFAAVMVLVVRPVLAWWLRAAGSGLVNHVPLAVGLAFGSAWVTATLGLHAVFGGFLAGLVMPRRDGTQDPEVVRPMSQTADLLLPFFFVTAGLAFDLGSLDRDGLALLALVLLISVGGKLGPAYAAGRLGGLGTRDSALVAALVNTRGLTELIALNVGLAAGLIGSGLFTVLVLMALITTLMTGPLLSLVGTGAVPAVEPAGTPAR